jgi:hypothetical protein
MQPKAAKMSAVEQARVSAASAARAMEQAKLAAKLLSPAKEAPAAGGEETQEEGGQVGEAAAAEGEVATAQGGESASAASKAVGGLAKAGLAAMVRVWVGVGGCGWL